MSWVSRMRRGGTTHGNTMLVTVYRHDAWKHFVRQRVAHRVEKELYNKSSVLLAQQQLLSVYEMQLTLQKMCSDANPLSPTYLAFG